MKIKTCTLLILLSQIVLINFAYASGLSPAEEVAMFKAAGFQLSGTQWHSECNNPSDFNFSPATIEKVIDLNGDNLPEALIVEGSSACYGNTGTEFSLISKQKNGAWIVMLSSIGIPIFLNTKGMNNFPDIEVGGPGFCFRVVRWNGKNYADNRFEYEGKVCKIN